jgi:hypothetical protein
MSPALVVFAVLLAMLSIGAAVSPDMAESPLVLGTAGSIVVLAAIHQLDARHERRHRELVELLRPIVERAKPVAVALLIILASCAPARSSAAGPHERAHTRTLLQLAQVACAAVSAVAAVEAVAPPPTDSTEGQTGQPPSPSAP